MDSILDVIWRFVRGDTDAKEFELWLYAQETLEDFLGNKLYLDIISADYRSGDAKWRVRKALEEFARSVSSMSCECSALPNTAVIPMACPGDAISRFDEIRLRGKPYWWLGVSRCAACGTPWLVAQEERQNDVFIFRRLTEVQFSDILSDNRWPDDFDKYETLLRLSREAGHQAIFFDPIGDSSLAWTMGDLARERPWIRLSELAELLNLDLETAAVIADEAITSHGALIEVDSEPRQ